MYILDMRTLMITLAINSFMNTVVIAVYWRQNRKYFDGIFWWVLSLVMQTIGFLLLGISGHYPTDVLIRGLIGTVSAFSFVSTNELMMGVVFDVN